MNLEELRKEFGPKEPNPLDQFPEEDSHILTSKEAARMLSDGLCKGPVESVGGRMPLNYNHIQPHNTQPCEHGVYGCREDHSNKEPATEHDYNYIDDRFVEEMDMATLYWMIGFIMLFIYPIASEIAKQMARPLY